MKKQILGMVCMVMFLLCVCMSAGASQTITAMASTVNPTQLEKVSSYARIHGYNRAQNTITVELMIPEVFAREEVKALAVGDSIFTDGEEVTIRSIEWQDEGWCLVINKEAEENGPGSICLYETVDGNYAPENDGRGTYNSLIVLECAVSDALLYYDYTSPDSHDYLFLPVVYTAAEFTAALENNEWVLDLDNVYVTFDGAGNLAGVHRFFVPWQ